MKCNRCPLFRSWSNESDSGESCLLFGDSWDSNLQYENQIGCVIGCYIDHHFIKAVEKEYNKHLMEESESWEELIFAEHTKGEDDA